MKELKLYQCEICGTQYKNKAECKECEKRHIKPKGITGTRYLNFKDNKKGYPVLISVEMEDGFTITYKR